MQRFERSIVAVVALAATWLFFCEYIPPTKRVHLWSDIEGYHYPLISYAHKSLQSGRVPLWDPSIYCGQPFAANIQAGLFYPPNWLVFAANANLPTHLRGPDLMRTGYSGLHGVRFTSVEVLAFVHVWLAFLFTFLWLRERTSTWFPACIGGAVAAFSGYMLSQMNHLGVACGYAWIPFALWGVEQANKQRAWRPLWKVAVGSALCALAGYPPTWVALWLIVMVYALALPWRRRFVVLVPLALLMSACLAAVQLLPSAEAAALKVSDPAYGGALPFGAGFYPALLLPNYFDQNRTGDGPEPSAGDYLYLGVPALFGFIWLIRRRQLGTGPALAVAAACMFIAADPTRLVVHSIVNVPLLADVVRRYNLIAGVVFSAAAIAAASVDDLIRARPGRQSEPRWVMVCWVAAVLIWSCVLVHASSTQNFLSGVRSGLYSAVFLALFTTGLCLFRAGRHAVIAVCLLAAVGLEYKVFGTNRRFNAVSGNVDDWSRKDARLGGYLLNGLDDEVYFHLLRHPEYRIAIHDGPHPTDLRHYKLATPQGFDPFLSVQYKTTVEAFQRFNTNRLFDVDPFNDAMLQQLAVRWIMTRQGSEMNRALLKDQRYRIMAPSTSQYVVFEYLDARPAWRFDGTVRMLAWEPEVRKFSVESPHDARLVLIEQWFPGWRATIDGRNATNERAQGAFQSVRVPAGTHEVEFRYDPLSLRIGAIISLAALSCLLLLRQQ